MDKNISYKEFIPYVTLKEKQNNNILYLKNK